MTFSVLTNIVAFLPMFFIPGVMGKIFWVIPAVVISVFAISLVESLFVLPSHLGHQKAHGKSWFCFVTRAQARFSKGFMHLVNTVVSPLLLWTIRLRYLTLALALAILAATVGYVASGRMGMVMFPKVESDYAYVSVALPFGSPVARTEAVIGRMVRIAQELADENGGEKLVEGIYSQVGTSSGGHQGSIRVFLTPPEQRTLSTAEFTQFWRERVGPIAGAEYVKFESDRGGPGSGAALTVELSHRSTRVLEQAGQDLAEALSKYAQVSDIDDGFSAGKVQLDVRIRPEGRSLGLTSQDVARQIRSAFFGAEALRQQRGRNEIKVMVRLPRNERFSLQNIEDFLVRTPAGTDVLLREVADVSAGRSYTSIDRREGRRVISVTADVNPRAEAASIQDVLKSTYLPELRERYQGLEFSFEGRQADIQEGMQALLLGLGMACLSIFALLAVPLRSYVQPLIIMTSIPSALSGPCSGT